MAWTYQTMSCSDPDIPPCGMKSLANEDEATSSYIPYSRKVTHDLDVQLLEQFGITNTRALQDLRSAERARAQHNHLPCTNDRLTKFTLVGAVPGVNIGDSDSLVALKDDSGDL